MAYVKFLDDQTLRGLVKGVLDVGTSKRKAVARDFQNNVIDPFSSLFDAAISEVDHETWMNSEMVRQCQKTLTNHIGNLHQKILGSVVGWEDLGTGAVVDLVCRNEKIIAEVKNKHNTVTGGKLVDQYKSLERLVTPKASHYKGYTSYFVNIIPKKPHRFDTTFEPSDKDTGMKCPRNEQIRVIDGASFYALVTGRDNAIEELYEALPNIIEDIYRREYGYNGFEIKDQNLFRQYFLDAYCNG